LITLRFLRFNHRYPHNQVCTVGVAGAVDDALKLGLGRMRELRYSARLEIDEMVVRKWVRKKYDNKHRTKK